MQFILESFHLNRKLRFSWLVKRKKKEKISQEIKFFFLLKIRLIKPSQNINSVK